MINFLVTNPNDMMLLIMHMSDGSWTEHIQPMRCPRHAHGVGLNISGKPKEDGSSGLAISASIEGCCQEFIDYALNTYRQLHQSKQG